MYNISIDDLNSETGNNSYVSGTLNQFDQLSQISDNPNNFNVLKDKEDCKTVKIEGKNKIIENDYKSLKNEESDRNVEQEDWNLAILRRLKRLLEIIEEEKIINETVLFTTIDSLTPFYQQAIDEEFIKGNLSNNKLKEKIHLLDEIKDLKTNQMNGNTMSPSVRSVVCIATSVTRTGAWSERTRA